MLDLAWHGHAHTQKRLVDNAEILFLVSRMLCSYGEMFSFWKCFHSHCRHQLHHHITSKIEHNCPITFQSSWEFLRWSRRSRSSTCLLSPPSIPRRPEFFGIPPLPLPESHCFVGGTTNPKKMHWNSDSPGKGAAAALPGNLGLRRIQEGRTPT